MEARILNSVPLSAAELRERVSQLRDQLQVVTLAYHLAREERQSKQVAVLLRKRSELTRLLFQTQGQLLRSFRDPIPVVPDVPVPELSSEPVLYAAGRGEVRALETVGS